MPFDNVGAYACQNLQVALLDYFGANSPEMRTYGSIAWLRWLLSPQNTANFERIPIESMPGKIRPVAFQINDPFCFDLARVERVCTDNLGTISQTPQEIVFEMNDIDPFVVVDGSGNPLKLKIDLKVLQTKCTINDQTWITNQISRYLLRYEEALSKQLLSLMQTHIGTNYAGEAITNIPLWLTVGGKTNLNPEALFAINQQMLNVQVDTNYAIIGDAVVNKILMYEKWQSGSDIGTDLSKFNPNNPYPFYDRNFGPIFGNFDFLAVPPGAVQLVSYNENAQGSSYNTQVTNLYSNGTIILPRTGLAVDWEWRFDYECKIWVFEAKLRADLAVVPPGGCNTPNVNGIIQFHDCTQTPIFPACPELPAA